MDAVPCVKQMHEVPTVWIALEPRDAMVVSLTIPLPQGTGGVERATVDVANADVGLGCKEEGGGVGVFFLLYYLLSRVCYFESSVCYSP